MKFGLKIGLLFFFCKVIVKWKWKLRNNRGVLEDFKKEIGEKKQEKKRKKFLFSLIKKIVKIYENESWGVMGE